MTEIEQKIIDRVNSFNLPGVQLLLTKEEYDICIKYGIDPKKIGRSDIGSAGKRISNSTNIGKYAPGKGYYKIVEIKSNYQVPDGRVFEEILITNYNSSNAIDFSNEEVLINSRPMYNHASIGPKIPLKKGMIIFVKEDTTVVNSSYKVVWEII